MSLLTPPPQQRYHSRIDILIDEANADMTSCLMAKVKMFFPYLHLWFGGTEWSPDQNLRVSSSSLPSLVSAVGQSFRWCPLKTLQIRWRHIVLLHPLFHGEWPVLCSLEQKKSHLSSYSSSAFAHLKVKTTGRYMDVPVSLCVLMVQFVILGTIFVPLIFYASLWICKHSWSHR